jgi:hypothetical protein
MVNDQNTAFAALAVPAILDRRAPPTSLVQAEMPQLSRTRFLQMGELNSPIIRTAISYWLSKQVDGAPMRRCQFDATEIPHLLPYLILLEVVRGVIDRAVLDFRYRVIGDVLLRYSRGNYTGKCFSEVDGQGPGSEVFTIVSTVVEQRRPVLLRPPYVGPHQQIFYCESTTMPLVDETGAVDRILIACDFLPETMTDHHVISARA